MRESSLKILSLNIKNILCCLWRPPTFDDLLMQYMLSHNRLAWSQLCICRQGTFKVNLVIRLLGSYSILCTVTPRHVTKFWVVMTFLSPIYGGKYYSKVTSQEVVYAARKGETKFPGDVFYGGWTCTELWNSHNVLGQKKNESDVTQSISLPTFSLSRLAVFMRDTISTYVFSTLHRAPCVSNVLYKATLWLV